jgi:glycosyltransferase involved in cell wall biosynthesis
MKSLVIIPAFNESESIVQLLRSIKKFKKKFDILVINDCSTDDTSELVKMEGIKIIDLPINLGIGGAVQTGYLYAFNHDYDIAVQLDGDNQHKPEFLKDLIKPIQEKKADIVIGSRFIQNEGFQSTAMRKIGIKYFQYLIRLLTSSKITDPTSGFRACNKRIVSEFVQYYPIDFPEAESIVSIKRKGYAVIEIPVVMNERRGGISSIRSLNSLYYIIKVTLAILIDKIKWQYGNNGDKFQ